MIEFVIIITCNIHVTEDYRVCGMGWLRLGGSLKLWVSFAKEPHKRDYILQKRPIILSSLLIVATPCVVARDRDVDVVGLVLCILCGTL